MPERGPRRLVLCADDFALDEAVSEGILRLVDAGRVSAVSCFTDSPAWPRAGAELHDRCAGGRRTAMGLHFNLTQDFGFGERPLGWWIAASLARSADPAAVRVALRRQLEAFREVAGAWPAFIDGHQHVHAFPLVRDVVAAVAAEARPAQPIPLRDVREFFGRTDAPFKRLVIRSLARAGRRRAAPRAVYLNDAMSGDYSLKAGADFAGLVAGWLAAAPARGLIMCHPAAGPADAGAGQRELAFLESDAFAELLARQAVELTPGADGNAARCPGA